MRSLVGGLHAVHLCTSVSVFFFLLFFLLTQVYLKVRQASSLALETPDPQLIAACAGVAAAWEQDCHTSRQALIGAGVPL